MSPSLVAHRYALSLYQLAQEIGQLEPVAQDMQGLEKLLTATPELKALLRSPVITNERKEAILKKIFSGRVTALLEKLIESLVRRNRDGILPNIAQEFNTIYDGRHNRRRVTIATATPISDAQQKSLTARLEKDLQATILLETVVNPRLIGGLRLDVSGRRVDATVAKSLAELRRRLYDTSYIEKI